jgi:hypothetical protein
MVCVNNDWAGHGVCRPEHHLNSLGAVGSHPDHGSAVVDLHNFPVSPAGCVNVDSILQWLCWAWCAGLSISYTARGPWQLMLVMALLWLLSVISLFPLRVAFRPKAFQVPLTPVTPALAMLAAIHLIGATPLHVLLILCYLCKGQGG